MNRIFWEANCSVHPQRHLSCFFCREKLAIFPLSGIAHCFLQTKLIDFSLLCKAIFFCQGKLAVVFQKLAVFSVRQRYSIFSSDENHDFEIGVCQTLSGSHTFEFKFWIVLQKHHFFKISHEHFLIFWRSFKLICFGLDFESW